MSTEKFEQEIAAKVAEYESAGKEIVPQFITHEIIQSHEAGLARQNDHTDFFRHFTYKGHRKEVGSYIAKRFGDNEDGGEGEQRQPVLPGFEYVQRHYIVKRGDESVAVAVDMLTDDEIDARVQLLRKRGAACQAHADELSRFKHIRGAAPLTKAAS